MLPSWNDSESKEAIVRFVTGVTREGGPDFVAPAERIAVFDNDGTLWSEKPMPFQLLFALDQVKAMAADHPEWKTRQPFASVLKGDMAGLMASGEKGLLQLVATTHTGMTTDEFAQSVESWITTAKHPTTGRLYTQMVYQPMLELLDYLRANGFKTFIVSGGGVEFMRPWAERTYGIPPEQVVGSAGRTKLEVRNNMPVLIKLPELDFVDDKAGKPIGIQSRIGRRPIAAFGNSDGELEMLQWTTAGPGARFALFVHHDDADREFAYDRADKLQQFSKGWDEALAKGWTVVSMKNDWKTIYPAAAPSVRVRSRTRARRGSAAGTPAIAGPRDERRLYSCQMQPGGANPTTASSDAVTRTAHELGSMFRPGDLLCNRFRVVRFIARGGMGELFEAEDTTLGERVALKTIRPEIAGAAAPRSASAARCSWPARSPTRTSAGSSTVRARAVRGRPGPPAVAFVTMELLHGETLSQRLQRGGPFPPRSAADRPPDGRRAGCGARRRHRPPRLQEQQRDAARRRAGASRSRVVVTDFGLAHRVDEHGEVDSAITATGDSSARPTTWRRSRSRASRSPRRPTSMRWASCSTR